MYVEGEKAARELGVRQRGGFFDDNRCVSSLPVTPERHAHTSACSACHGQDTKCLAILLCSGLFAQVDAERQVYQQAYAQKPKDQQGI